MACLPGEYGPNLAVMAANGFDVRVCRSTGTAGSRVDEAATVLAVNPPALVHLTPLASHRGIGPAGCRELAEVCRGLGVPLVIDAAQALRPHRLRGRRRRRLLVVAQVDRGPTRCRHARDRPALAERLRPRLPPPEWDLPFTVMQSLEHGEANLAARVGFRSLSVNTWQPGPENIRARLAELGRLTRTALADVDGWRVVEPVDEPTAITTLEPTNGADPQRVRAWLIAERGIVTTYAEVQRAPFEMAAPVLRVSPHVDTTADDLDIFAEALVAATAQV